MHVELFYNYACGPHQFILLFKIGIWLSIIFPGCSLRLHHPAYSKVSLFTTALLSKEISCHKTLPILSATEQEVGLEIIF